VAATEDHPPTRTTGRWQAARQFLGLRRSIVGLLAMVVLVGLGERIPERFLPVYLQAVGGGTLAIGLLQALSNLLNALYSYPGGYLSDRLGAKRALLVFNLMAMAGFAIVVAIPTWQAVLVGAVLFLAWEGVSLPATMHLVADVLPATQRTMGVSMHSLVRRIPMALGPVLGGLLIARWGERDGVRLAFAIALVLAGAAIVLQQRLIAPTQPTGLGAEERSWIRNHPLRLLREMSPALRGLLISDILIRFCEQIPYAFVVIWCMKIVAAPVDAPQFGALTAIEMAAAVVCYVPVAYFADRSGKKRFVVLTFVFFTLFPLVLWYCQSFWPLAAAFVLRGLKEFGEPTRKALIVDLCPAERRATMFGFYYLLRDLIVSLAALGGAFLWQISPATNLLTAFACGLLGTLCFALFGRDLRRAP